MRWTKRDVKIGDYRIRSGFLFLPKRIGEEYRWLEVAVWKERREESKGGGYWRSCRWLEQDEHQPPKMKH